VSATVVTPDAPPALRAPAAVGCGDRVVPAGPTAVSARLDGGALRVRCEDGVEVVRPATWLRATGDGRDAIDVVLRPCRRTLTITWRDGRRGRFDLATLRA
jgi:hypothetical protein